MRRKRLAISVLFLTNLALGAVLPECDEYLSKSPCKITVNMGKEPMKVDGGSPRLQPRAHGDLQVKPVLHANRPAAEDNPAVLSLVKSSPFMTCTVSAAPGAPTRDLSANIGSLITAGAGVGAPAMSPFAYYSRITGFDATIRLGPTPPPGAKQNVAELDAIESDLGTLEQKVVSLMSPYWAFGKALKKDWLYTFDSEKDAVDAIADLRNAAENVLAVPLPDGDETFSAPTRDLRVRLAKYAGVSHPGEEARIGRVMARLGSLENEFAVKAPSDAIAELTDRRKTIRVIHALLLDLNEKREEAIAEKREFSYTTQELAMRYFSGKTVTETIACKDAVTTNPAFDNIVFTAYYEALPHIDISVGAMASLLGGRQVGTLTGPWSPTDAQQCAANAANGSKTPCGPTTILGYKTRSSYQFMPGVFVEWRMKNMHCPWAQNGGLWHPAGYVCSVGVAGGVDINPNNGGAAAEFFEGFSFGIQRFSILLGAHNGRYQQFGGGYYVGEVFPTGTSVTAPTSTNWATHPSFGIAYRIPLR
jgi:hypothetical protein